DGAIAPQEARTGALLAAEADRAIVEAGGEPFEADGNLQQLTAEPPDDAIDQAAGDERLADGRAARPSRAMLQQVIDSDCEEVVGVQEPGGRRDDAVPVGVGVVAE